LREQFEQSGSSLVKDKRIVLLPPKESPRNGDDLETATAAAIYCRWKLFETINITPTVSELMGVDSSACNEEVVLTGFKPAKKQYPLNGEFLLKDSVPYVYVNGAKAKFADVFFFAGKKKK
jgi:hypothetical protein